MKKLSLLSDDEFIERLNQCTLDPKLFDHEAHLRLAWINVKRYKLLEAERVVQTQLFQFVSRIGEESKYNDKLTAIAVQIIAQYSSQSKSKSFSKFIEEFPVLKNNFKELIEEYSKSE